MSYTYMILQKLLQLLHYEVIFNILGPMESQLNYSSYFSSKTNLVGKNDFFIFLISYTFIYFLTLKSFSKLYIFIIQKKFRRSQNS